ncbi:SMC family ATPase [Bradyrhizobium sp. NBAIM20]|uniref:AAA family ATPase n=1 Tax=unclassified Bradyrhizobium TaxID=2631580 RepID=UPI001CD7A379|nr:MULTISPECIES: SMC family ATPase [unclassified Bradyrhizobium]MCA1416022.1 SMC family ATPase [Bradyrhizobium sp. NBAIM20]MCA1466062.1 SMC family ATPase [Bradyrhizobium sp. NBAIM18]
MSALNEGHAEVVKACLSQVPGGTLSVLEAGQGLPVTILQTDRVVAAFAFAGSEPRATFEETYEAFKTEAERSKDWDQYDLSYVLCIASDTDKLDQLASDIETDVYFCRKFVVPLTEHVGNALARLPFLPLTQLDGPALRPASAQTFLQQSGVPTTLARQIVVQHERSAERIVEACLANEYGTPKAPTRVATLSAVFGEQTSAPVLLESITIENFRAYRAPMTFEIGSEITVLYGPNGFGKTSFFDAIDFGITGSIGRLKIADTDHFREVAAHLDSKPEDARVALTYRSDGKSHTIDRSVADPTHALLDGSPTDRKPILKQLTKSGDAVAERIDNLISLFRASHLFSQDNQALTQSFKDHCTLPREIVSRMLAFEDYENALKKSANIVTILKNSLNALSSEISESTASLKADKSELDGLRRTIKDKSNIGALNAELSNLRAALKDIDVDADSGAADATAVRGWRATLEARIAESEGRIAVLSELAKEVVRLPPLVLEGKDLRAQLEAGDARRMAAEQSKTSIQQQLDAVRKRVAEIAAQVRQAQSALDNLKWVRDQRPGYATALNSLNVQTERLNRATEAIAADRNRSETASAYLQQKSSQLAMSVERQAAGRKRSADLEALSAALGPWKASTDRIAEIRQQEVVLNQTLLELRAAEPTLQARLDSNAPQQATLERVIADADRSQSELRQLLSQLQKHITDGNCPLCGVDHGSQDELIRHIQEQMTLDSAGTARTELAGVRQRIQEITRHLAGNREAQKAAQAQLIQLADDRTARDREINVWANAANGLGLNASAGLTQLTRQIAANFTEARKEIEDSNAAVKVAADAADAAKAALDALTKSISQQESARTAVNTELERIRKGLTTLRSDPRLSGVTLDSSDDELNEAEQDRSGLLNELRQSHDAATKEQTRLQGMLDAESRIIAELAGQLPVLRRRVNENEQARRAIIARLADSNLPEDSDEQELIGKLGEETQALARLRALHQRVASAEIGLDAATTAAALARLETTIATKNKLITEKKASRAARMPWRDYFAAVEKILSDEQAAAIANFTRQYGPRTSVIQRRLRSVYGFDDVEIISRKSEISVTVKRHGVELRPVDYFSESQKQTLQLGLFLTACSGQNWSSLAPVFLDDPVTHFDDLNIYALLDLIMGLLKSDFGTRQFIISTCDEKLFQLARQKFNYLQDSVRFYRFRAIGEDGPLVERIGS